MKTWQISKLDFHENILFFRFDLLFFSPPTQDLPSWDTLYTTKLQDSKQNIILLKPILIWRINVISLSPLELEPNEIFRTDVDNLFFTNANFAQRDSRYFSTYLESASPRRPCID